MRQRRAEAHGGDFATAWWIDPAGRGPFSLTALVLQMTAAATDTARRKTRLVAAVGGKERSHEEDDEW